jgi:hypothetical protein
MNNLTLIGIILLVILILVLVVWLFRYYNKRRAVKVNIKPLLSQEHDATQHFVIDGNKIPLSAQGNEYSISFWMFIKDYSYRYGKDKVVLFRGDSDMEEMNPMIFLNPKHNDMTIKIQLQTSSRNKSRGYYEKDPNDNIEHFRTTLPSEYFNLSNNLKSNISGNNVFSEISAETNLENFDNGDNTNNNGNENEGELSGNNTINISNNSNNNETPSPVIEGDDDNQEVVGNVNARLDRIETQIKGLLGVKDDEDDWNSQNNNTITSEQSITYDECVVKDIPLQKWNHVVVSLYNNNLEVYLDGKLHQVCVLSGYPSVNTNNIHLNPNGGFDGFLANIQYANMTLTPSEIYKIYKGGPKVSKNLVDMVKGFGQNLSGLVN